MPAASAYPPGPQGKFPYGSARDFSRDRLGFLTQCAQDYGDFAHFRVLNRHFYFVNDPDDVRFVLVEHPEYFHKTPLLKRNTQAVIGNGLLTSEDEYHKRQRRLAQPAFHHQRVGAYGDVMVAYTQRMLNGWERGSVIDIHEAMMRLTMEIVGQTLFNSDVSQDADAIGEAITRGLKVVAGRLNAIINLPDWIPTAANRKSRANVEFLNNTMQRIIDQHRARGDDQGDLLSMLLLAADENGERMTDQQVRDEAMTIFIAGHETTANAMTWTLYLLAQHPDVEQKLHEEVDTLGAAPTMHDLARLPYTDMIIKESMRLYPPAWIVPRLVIRDFTLRGYRIPRNSIVFTCPYTMHRHPRYYEQPQRFIPERWTAEMEKTLPKYAYFPFGGGPRVCIGNGFAMMEARLLLTTIAQGWQPRLVEGQTVVPEPVITLRARDGIMMRLLKREGVIHREIEASLVSRTGKDHGVGRQ
jgi:cytochrome P450